MKPRPSLSRASFRYLIVALGVAGGATAQAPSGTPDAVTLAATRSHYGAYAHSGLRSDASMAHSNFGAEIQCVNGPLSGGEANFLYPLELAPLAGTLESVQVWAYDLDGGDLRMRVLRVCHVLQAPYVLRAVLAETEVAPAPGLGPVRVDLPVNLPPTSSPECSNVLEVRMARAGQNCQGNQVTVMRVRMQVRPFDHLFRGGFLDLDPVGPAPGAAGGGP